MSILGFFTRKCPNAPLLRPLYFLLIFFYFREFSKLSKENIAENNSLVRTSLFVLNVNSCYSLLLLDPLYFYRLGPFYIICLFVNMAMHNEDERNLLYGNIIFLSQLCTMVLHMIMIRKYSLYGL